MVSASVTFTDITANAPVVYVLEGDVFSVGFRTEGLRVNIPGDAFRDLCCRRSFRLKIVRRTDGGHALVFPKQADDDYIPPVRINHDWIVIEPNRERKLYHGDFIVCGCQLPRDGRINCGPCVFEYRVLREEVEEIPPSNALVPMKKRVTLEDLPPELLRMILSKVEPIAVATNVAATSSKFFAVARGKVPYKALECGDQEASPCEAYVWKAVMAYGHMERLQLTSNSGLFVEALIDMLGGSGLEALRWRHDRSTLLGPDFDVEEKLFLVLRRSPRLRRLALLGDLRGDANIWEGMPHVPKVRDLLVDGQRGDPIPLNVVLQKIGAGLLVSLVLNPTTVQVSGVTALQLQGLERAGIKRGDALDVKLIAERVPTLLMTLNVELAPNTVSAAKTLLGSTRKFVNLRLDMRALTFDSRTWYELLQDLPKSLQLLHIISSDFEDDIFCRVVRKHPNLRVFKLDVITDTPPFKRVCGCFTELCKSLEIMSVTFFLGGMTLTTNLDNFTAGAEQSTFVKRVPISVRREGATVRGILDDVFCDSSIVPGAEV